MKKLIFGVAITLVASFVNAATYNWSAVGSVFYGSSESFDEFDGYSIYAFDAVAKDLTTVSGALANGDLTVLNSALGNGTVNGYEFSFNGTGLTDDGAATPYANAFFVLVGEEGGDKYYTTYTIDPIKVTDAVVTGGAKLSTGDGWVVENLIGGEGWTAIATAGGEGGGGSGDVPEPTSGLLMLLGVAGLALRRKQA